MNDPRLPEPLRSLLGQLSAPQAKDTPGLQAADLLAYELYQHASRLLAAGKNVPPRSLLRQLLTNRLQRQRFIMFDGKKFAQIEAAGKAAFEQILKAASPATPSRP